MNAVNRRQALAGLAASGAFFSQAGLFAEELVRTASIGEGPFYPDRLPLDTDNDLVILNDAITPAVGEITHLSGRVLGGNGQPIRNAFVEIWQVDNNACYLHTQSANQRDRDSNFQGYGRFLTDAEGRYYFRTIKPVPYPGRTPHIHFAVSMSGKRVLTTQMLIKGHPQNETDGLFRQVRDQKSRDSVLVEFKPVKESTIGELAANFDMVLGQTAFEDDRGQLRGVAPPLRESRRPG